MTKRKELPQSSRDTEKPHETVAESFSDGLGVELLTVRLSGMWSELIHTPEPRSPSSVPLLDDMKGIRQWD